MNCADVQSYKAGFESGRRHGFAIAAVVVSLVSFLSLLGAEKAILAIVFGWIALKGTERGSLPNRLGKSAITIGGIFLTSLAILLATFWAEVAELIEQLEKLS